MIFYYIISFYFIIFHFILFCLGFLKVSAFGKGSNGTKVKAVFYFPTDPGYRDTARMLVESGNKRKRKT